MVVLSREYLDKTIYENEIIQDLNKMDLSRLNLTMITSNSFEGLVKLDYISLAFNNLRELGPNLFATLSNLTQLHLMNNKLEKIEANIFNGLIKLQTLWLSANEIKHIEANSFNSLSSLIELKLDNNKLKRLDASILSGLVKLEILELQYNQIGVIEPDTFAKLTNLKLVRMFDNKLKRVDSSMFKGLARVEKLSLSNNEIEDIEANSFNTLTSIKELFFFCNKLTRINPNAFKGLKALERLSLSYNEIEELNDEKLFEGLASLRVIFLQRNNLIKINRKCFELLEPTIQVIELYENPVKDFLSYRNLSAKVLNSDYNEDNLKKFGFQTDWKRFLKQFSEKDLEQAHRIVEPKQKEQSLEQEFENQNQLTTTETSSPSANQSILKAQTWSLYQDSFNRYEQKMVIGFGSFGIVYKVLDKSINKLKAMKMIKYNLTGAEHQDKPLEELDEFKNLWDVGHENIVKYFDHFKHQENFINYFYIITELCPNGDLESKIAEAIFKGKQFSEKEIFDWSLQTTHALKYLHTKIQMVHRDIKPGNMLLTEQNAVKLSDLGLAKVLRNASERTYAGTSGYTSPELERCKNDIEKENELAYWFNTDVWSLGCVLYELICLKKAFPEGRLGPTSRIPSFEKTGRFALLLKKMLEYDRNIRINSKELYDEMRQTFADLDV